MKKRTISSKALKGVVATLTISLLATFVNMGIGFTPFASNAEAACAPLDTSKGVVTSTVNIPVTGSYRVWSRIMAPDSTNNSFYLEVDDTTCGIVVGDSVVTSGSWQWVDYQNGTTSSKITLNLSAGNHTIRMVGREDDVQLDRVLFLSDTSCVPSGTGDNCADSTPSPEDIGPLYRLYSPTKGHHLYTTSAAERDKARTQLGYRDEGVAYDVSKVAGADNIPVYRVYLSSIKKHHWTKSITERNGLVANGWRDEGIAWYGLTQ